jgi:hypothetical protein
MIIRKPTLEESGILAQYNRDAAIEAGNQPLDTEKSEKGVLAVIEDESKGFYRKSSLTPHRLHVFLKELFFRVIPEYREDNRVQNREDIGALLGLTSE